MKTMEKDDRSPINSGACQRLLTEEELTDGGSLFRVPSSLFDLIMGVGVVFLFVSLATRCALLFQSAADADMSIEALSLAFTSGLFYDAVAFTYFMVPLAAFLAYAPQAVFVSSRLRFLIYGIFIALFALLLFTACAEYLFWQEFESRFDFVAVDYLVYQREVTENIRQSYPLEIILPCIGLLALLFFAAMKRYIDRCLRHPAPWRKRAAVGSLILLLPLCSAVCITGTSREILSNRINNELSKNGMCSFFEALFNNRLEYAKRYATRDPQDLTRRFRRAVCPANQGFITPPGPVPEIWRTVENGRAPEARHNVVLVVLESMSGDFLHALGGTKGLTPNLDELARQGLFFSDLYATGTRTVRGLEAIALSAPPTPPVSIVKRPNNGGLFTIGTPFVQRGYETSFFYGGHSYFDNMEEFFGGNGFRVIDRADLSSDEITFSNAWGVCDEDIYRRAVREADASYQRGKKFFSFIMTTSNHRPFTYPEGKINIPSGDGRAGGVKYADFAVGELIKNAATRPWFSDTIFVFIADHCTRSGGKNEISVGNYQIPCVFYGPQIIKPATVAKLTSQIDIAPTLFDLLNWQYASSFVGRSVFKTQPGDNRAFASNHLTLGYLKDNTLVTLAPTGGSKCYRLDPVTSSEKEITLRKDLVEEAITYYQGASSMYENMLQSREQRQPPHKI